MRKLLIASTLGIVFLAGAWFGQGNVGNVTTPVEHSVYSSGLKNSEVHHQQPIGLQKQILSELWLSTKAQYMHMTLFVFFVWALMLLAVCVRMRSWLKKDHVDCCDMVPAATAMGKLTHSSRGIGDGYLARQIDQAANTIPVKAPRSLLKNPYGHEQQGLTFEDRVQAAAEASLRHDRVIGVIRFDLSTEATSSSTVSAVLDPDEIASRFISKLRQTDCVYITDENHVCVFISLLHTRNDLNRIAGRLFADLSNLAESTALKLEFVPGTAMYPLDGYSGEALMEAALYRIKPMTQGITIQSGDHKQLSIPGAAPERSRVFPEKPLPYQGRLQ